MKVLVSLLSLLTTMMASSSSHAFLAERPVSVRPITTTATKPRRVQTPQQGCVFLNLVEPSHLWDQAVSTLIASSTDATGPPEAGGVSYSKASYYTILGLYLLSLPGLWSTVKRSTKAKVKRKTFVSKGEKASTGTGKSLREEAGGIMACK